MDIFLPITNFFNKNIYCASIICGIILIVFPVFIFIFIKAFIKLLLLIYYINFHIANFFSNSKKTKKNNNKDNLPNILINNKDFDSNCLINLKLMEMIEKKDNNNRLQTDFLDMKQKMLETYFNQRIFEIEMKQKIKDLEEGQKQTKITQPKTKGFLDEIPNTLRQILEKLKNVEEMQFEILQDYTKKTHYNSNDKILYVHPEDFLHINKALMQQKYKQLKN